MIIICKLGGPKVQYDAMLVIWRSWVRVGLASSLIPKSLTWAQSLQRYTVVYAQQNPDSYFKKTNSCFKQIFTWNK